MTDKFGSFGWALEQMKDGASVAREGQDKAWIKIMTPESEIQDLPASPYLLMKTAGNNLVPWIPTHSDLLADDWEVVGRKAIE